MFANTRPKNVDPTLSTQTHSLLTKWWLYPNLISLDAPIIAIIWQEIIAISWHVHLKTPERTTIFLATWIIYLIDRWFDSKHGACSTARHQFIGCIRGWLLLPIIGLLLIGGLCALMALPFILVLAALPLVGACSLYLVWTQVANHTRYHFIKSFIIGSLFTAGVVIAPQTLSVTSLPFQIPTWIALSGLLISNHFEISRQEERLYNKKVFVASGIPLAIATMIYCVLLLVLFDAPICFAIIAISSGLLIITAHYTTLFHPENASFLIDSTLWIPSLIYLGLIL